MPVKRRDQITAPASRQVWDSNQPQFMHKAVPPEIPVKKYVEHAVETHAGRSIRPPREREVGGSERFRGHPRQSNRQQRQQKRNHSPFAGVCAVAVHTSTCSALRSRTNLSACWVALSTLIAAGRHWGEELTSSAT